jgi:hypothetical protein
MNTQDFSSLEIGDRIEFRSPTRHNSRKAIRKITGFPQVYETLDTWGDRSPDFVLVRFEGTPCFYVRAHEIIRRVS